VNTFKNILFLLIAIGALAVFLRAYLVDHGMTGEAGRARRHRRRMERRPGGIVSYSHLEAWSDGVSRWHDAISYARDGLELAGLLERLSANPAGVRNVRIVMETRDRFGAVA